MPQFDAKDFREMTALQAKVSEVLLRANREGVDAVIAAFALIRLVRELMDKVDANASVALVNDCLVPFLQREPVKNDDAARIITLH
jgi:hypothetical protein